MKASIAEKLGYNVRRIRQPSTPAPEPVVEPTPGPKVEVTINNEGVADAIKELAAKLKPQTGITVESVKEIVASGKPGITKRVGSCDMEHEYDARSRPVKTHVRFYYEDRS